jgi:hypothetical protein
MKKGEVIWMECPECKQTVNETKGSPVSPYINVFSCPGCGWTKLRCGESSCDSYLEAEEMGYENTVRYTCVTCGWTGTGTRF